MNREQWKYLVQILLSPEAQDVLAIVLADEAQSQAAALRLAAKQQEWHDASQRAGRLDQLADLPNLLRRYAASHKPGNPA